MYSSVLVAEFGGDAIQKLLEVDLAAKTLELCDHVEDGGVLALEAEALHGRLQLPWVDLPRCFSVKQVEGFPQLLDLVLSQSWTLYLLLGGAFRNGCLPHPILIKFKLNYTVQPHKKALMMAV